MVCCERLQVGHVCPSSRRGQSAHDDFILWIILHVSITSSKKFPCNQFPTDVSRRFLISWLTFPFSFKRKKSWNTKKILFHVKLLYNFLANNLLALEKYSLLIIPLWFAIRFSIEAWQIIISHVCERNCF